jgi:ligand-binding sensor domain-containing protein
MVWVGTSRGVYSIRSGEEKAHREPDWPYGEVISLAVEPTTGSKWLVTEQGIGRIVDNAWQPLERFPMAKLQLRELLVGKHDLYTVAPPTKSFLGEHQTWAVGASDPDRGTAGLYRIGIDEYEPAFSLDSEDTLSNAVQCLCAHDESVWMGTARGLCSYDGQNWRNYANEDPELRDVRAILPGQTPESLWIGSGQTGFHLLQSGVYLPGHLSSRCVVAMAAGSGGALWAATPAEILQWKVNAAEWERIARQANAPAIQELCPTKGGLWVGTVDGLWYYDPELDSLYPPAEGDPVRHLSVEALAVDPVRHRLWAGTDEGLYCQINANWVLLRKTAVHAVAFSPERMLWLGTDHGLEGWRVPDDEKVLEGRPLVDLSSANSGLAADLVTALSLRSNGSQRQLWIGSSAGVSCYEYTP